MLLRSEYYLRLVLGHETEDLLATAGFDYYEKAGQFLKQRSDPSADQPMVVGDEDAGRIHVYLALNYERKRSAHLSAAHRC
jgi:hypothetical protein